MELSQGAHKASKFASEDFISNMPEIVITNILDRLPLHYAVRTSILSRNWRFKWTLLSQLVFDVIFHEYLLDKECESSYVRVISRLLLRLKGAITKFVLYVDQQGGSVNVEDISHWILFLSTKGIKDLTLMNDSILKLPTHLFSCFELKHLVLDNCRFDPPANFHGFPNLLSLELSRVQFESGKFGEFFTRCPLLEILKIGAAVYSGKVNLAEIAKLANLKILFLYLWKLDNICSISSIFELLDSLPKLQELQLQFIGCMITEDGAKKRLLTTFPCLKTLKLIIVDLSDGFMLSFVFEIIRSLPNLLTVEIIEYKWDVDPTPAICSLDVDYNTIRQLPLQSVVFKYFEASENVLCLLRYLLACSPFLKKIFICSTVFQTDKEKLMFAKKLLKFPRASPVVDIDLN